MNLRLYLELNDIKKRDFAKIIGIQASTLTNYLFGYRKPKLEIALKIEKVTKGKVTIQDLLNHWETNKNHGKGVKTYEKLD